MESSDENIKYLSTSLLRYEMLNILDGSEMDLQDLMTELESPRTTLQRNLTTLKEKKWVEETSSSYTTTSLGHLVLQEWENMKSNMYKIEKMSQFLNAVPKTIDLNLDVLNGISVTESERSTPHLPRRRLSTVFSDAQHIQAVLPILSYLSIERSRHTREDAPHYNCVLSRDAFSLVCQEYSDTDQKVSRSDFPSNINYWICSDEIPYGLLVSNDELALVAYDEMGHMRAIVESSHKEAVEWGKEQHKIYVTKSKALSEIESLS